MAKFAFILPRGEMVAIARRIAEELEMDVVLNSYVLSMERLPEILRKCKELKADIIVARGRQAYTIRMATDIPVVEIQLTGQEIAVLLRKAKDLVPKIRKPKIGVVTSPNMIGDISPLGQVLDIEVHTYLDAGQSELEYGAMRAVDDGMDVVLGGDIVVDYCRRLNKPTLFFEGTEESIYASLRHARDAGIAIDVEQKNTAHLQTLLNYSFYGILELTLDGKISQANDMACKILKKTHEELEGSYLESLIALEDLGSWKKVVTEKKEMFFTLVNVAGINVVMNAAAVMAGESAESIVVSFYEMRKIERGNAGALREHYRLHGQIAWAKFERVAKSCPDLQNTLKQARTFAGVMHPVLILGEPGSGKSTLAECIHNASPCATGPFVFFDSRSNLTGQAMALRRAFLAAEGGSICIDSLETLDAESQYALSCLIENAVVRDDEKGINKSANVRVICLSGQDADTVFSGRALRRELCYAFAPMRLDIPPLRERPQDLRLAIDSLVDEAMKKLDRFVALTADAWQALLGYQWPGNYTQLKAFIQRMVLTAPSRTIRGSYVAALLKSIYSSGLEPEPGDLKLNSEAEELVRILRENGGSRIKTAQQLGISKTTLWRRMKENGIYGI